MGWRQPWSRKKALVEGFIGNKLQGKGIRDKGQGKRAVPLKNGVFEHEVHKVSLSTRKLGKTSSVGEI